MSFIVENEKQLVDNIYSEVREKLKAPLKVGLKGDLGAGKTTLVKGLLEKAGVSDTVTSPTFTICKSYKSPSISFLHLDLYRFEKGQVAPEIVEYINDRKSIVFVEWPENIAYPLDKYNVLITLKAIDENKREVEIKWN